MRTDQPTVSIVIPCHNGRRFVGDAIRSALGQTYRAIEVIVIDDGSTDDSVSVIRAFGDAVRCQVIRNQGAAAARNIGAGLATGELVQFLDADDLLHPTKLERMVPLAQEDCAAMVFCKAAVLDMDSGGRLGSWGSRLTPEMDAVAYVFSSVLQTGTPLHWKENLNHVGGFRAEMPPCDDPDLHFRLAAAGVRFRQLPEELLTVRRVEGSLSKRRLDYGIQMQKKLALDAIALLEQIGGLTDERAEAIAGFLASSARRALRLGDSGTAVELFRIARETHVSGGIQRAYCAKTRMMRRVVGSTLTEMLASWKRRILRQHEIG
jgi:glycosyltransferase involved in cell wall biosynthesis